MRHGTQTVLVFALCGLLLSPFGAAFAQVTDSSGEVVPGSIDNEVHIDVHNSSREPLVGLTARVIEAPPSILNLRIEPSRIDRIEHDTSVEFTILFDVAAGAAESELDPIKFEVVAEEGELGTTRANLRLTITPAPDLSVCAIRNDAPEDFPPENAIDYCDPEREPIEYDRVAVFFTPPRDLREPVEEQDPFLWRILGPNGDQQLLEGRPYGRVRAFAPREEESTPFAKEGSPGRFAAVLDLWDPDDKPDPAEADQGPGTYTVQTIAARYDVTGVFGQGDATVGIAIVEEGEDGERVYAEWEDVKTFDIASSRLHFQGFVMEKVNDVWWPDREDVWEGKLTIDDPRVTGSTVLIGAKAWWRPAKINGYGRFPEEDILRATSRLTLEFPEQLNPGHELMGEIGTRLEALERDKFFFTAAMHLLVPTGQTPPDRHLVDNGGPTPWSPGGPESPDSCIGESFGGSWRNRFGIEHEQTPVGDVPAFDAGAAYWLWPRVPLTPGFCLTREPSAIEAQIMLASGTSDDLAGDPERTLLENLSDPETMWIIPVFVNLTDKARPNERTLEMKTYGYAIYKAVPGTYTGPSPTSSPDAGDGPDDSPDGAEPDPDDPSGGDDADDGDDSDTDTGSGDDPTTGDPDADDPRTGDPVAGDPTGGDPDNSGNDRDAAFPPTGGIVPSDPDVTALIREWIGVAKPPENILQGADLHYNHRGRKVGTVPGGIIEQPEESTLAFDPTYLWVNFRANDSVDHCTMEQFVQARVAGESIAQCGGRYREVTNVVGQPAAAARDALEAAGLEVDLQVGDPPPSAELAFTVAQQTPSGATAALRGTRIEIDVYGAYVTALAAPDVVGLQAAAARMQVEQAGMVAEIVVGDEAPSAESAYSVYAQEPGAGVVLEAGATVQLSIYADYRPRLRIPYLGGSTVQAAREQLVALGLSAVEGERVEAHSPGSEGLVADTQPGAGTEVDAGAEVRLLIYGAYTHPSCQSLLDNGRSESEAGNLDRARQLFVEAKDLDCPTDWLDSAIADLDRNIAQLGRCNELVTSGNAQAGNNELEAALASYRQARSAGCTPPGLDEGIANIEGRIRARDEQNRRCNELITSGNAQAGNNELEAALASYRQARSEGCTPPGLDEGIANIEAILARTPPDPQPDPQPDPPPGPPPGPGGPFWIAAGLYLPMSQESAGEGDPRAAVESRLADLSQWVRAAPLLLSVDGAALRFYARDSFTRGSDWAMPVAVQARLADGQPAALNGALLLRIEGTFDSVAAARAAIPALEMVNPGDVLLFRNGDGRTRQNLDRDGTSSTLSGGPLVAGWSPESHRAAMQFVTDMMNNLDFCFVATAVYQSHTGAPLDQLRYFRDEVLLGSSTGRRLAMLYYRSGPRAARWIEQHPAFRPLLRPAFDLVSTVIGRAARSSSLRILLDAAVQRTGAALGNLPPDPGPNEALRRFRPGMWRTLMPWLPPLRDQEPNEEATR